MTRFAEEMTRLGAAIRRAHETRAGDLLRLRQATCNSLKTARTFLGRMAARQREEAAHLGRSLREGTGQRACAVRTFLGRRRMERQERNRQGQHRRWSGLDTLRRGVRGFLTEARKRRLDFSLDRRAAAHLFHRALGLASVFSSRHDEERPLAKGAKRALPKSARGEGDAASADSRDPRKE